MTFNEMVARFKAILNRSDCDDAQASIYLQDSISRITRDCRLPNMERSVTVNVLDQPMTFVAIPTDLIQLIDIYVTDAHGRHALEMVPDRDALRNGGTRTHTYSRFQGQYNLHSPVPFGGQVTIQYYGEFSPFATGDDSNEISTSNPDLVYYGALSFAGDVFSHPSTDRWESRYQQILGQVQQVGIDVDSQGGSTAIQPMYQE